jgi:hypothetical protein
MKKLFVSLVLLTSLFLFSCDTSTDHECKRNAMNELVFVSLHCSDPTYLAKNGYTDFDDCLKNTINIVELTFISCKGRDGVFP